MEYKAVLFDLDDTLYGSFAACDAYAYERLAVYAAQTLHVSGEAFVRAFADARARLARAQPGMPPLHDRVLAAQGALERMGLSVVRFAREVHHVYWDAVLSKMELRPGVYELLDMLATRGVKTAVCTDMLADVQLSKLERLGLTDKLTYLVSSEEAGRDKPAPPIFWLALQKCGCAASEAVMVGDNFLHDIQGALDCGIDGIWLNWSGLPCPKEARSFSQAKDFYEVTRLVQARL